MFVNNALCVLVTKNLLDRACIIARAMFLSDLEAKMLGDSVLAMCLIDHTLLLHHGQKGQLLCLL